MPWCRGDSGINPYGLTNEAEFFAVTVHGTEL